jgi:hypothetical protein
MYKQFLSENLKGRAHFGYISVNGRTKFKCIPENFVFKLWVFIHLTLDSVNCRFHCENGNEILVLQKQENT